MQLTSLSLALTRAGFLSFSPASLFAAGEPGVWYEPSLTNGTCFQDSSGTTPVTAVEQPVGLILDKSKGLVLGPERVGDAAIGLTGSATAATYNTSTGQGSVTRVDLLNQSFVQWASLTANGLHRIEISCQTGSIIVRTGVFSGPQIAAISEGQSIRFYGNADSAGRITITNTTSAGTSTFTVISVRELPGNHATQTTATSRPVLSARYNLLTKTEQFDDAVWTKSGLNAFGSGSVANTTSTLDPLGGNTADFIQENTATSGHGLYQPVSLSVGTSVTFSVYVKAAGRTWISVEATNSGNASTYFDLGNGVIGNIASGRTASIQSIGNGWYKCSVTQTLTGGTIYGQIFTCTGNGASLSYTGDGTSGIYIWGADLRAANDALNQPAYQRVNTATDYDADPSKFKPYLRFDGVDDWLVTPTITPGTDKAQVFAGVRKLSDAARGVVVELSTSTANAGMFVMDAPNALLQNYSFASRYDGVISVAQTNTGTFIAPITNVLTGIGNISGDSTILRVNGTQAASSTADQGPGNYGSYPLYIGRRGGTTLPFNGHLYGLIVRFGANLPAATIASTETWLNQRTGAY